VRLVNELQVFHLQLEFNASIAIGLYLYYNITMSIVLHLASEIDKIVS